MLNNPKITVHMIVRNEENFVWYAIMSVIDYVDKIIIFDNGSKDKTVEIIKTIDNPKIVFEEKEGAVEVLRQEQFTRTETDWFLLIDGDEVYPKDTILTIIDSIKNAPGNKVAIVLRTKNCVGDLSHFMSEDTGKYSLLGKTGYLTLRAFKKNNEYHWAGVYPLEAYVDGNNNPITKQDEKLLMLDKYYWHLTHLKRSSLDERLTPKRKGKFKEELGITNVDKDLPEIFYKVHPLIVPPPPFARSTITLIKSVIITPIKIFKRKLQ